MLGICLIIILIVIACSFMKQDTNQNKYSLEARRKKVNLYRNMGILLKGLCFVTFAYGAYKMAFGPSVTAELGSQAWTNQFNASYAYDESLSRMWPVLMFIFAITGGLGQLCMNKYKKLSFGLCGEERVSHALNSLPTEYTVYNNVPIEKDGRRSEIGSLVVSKYGIFLGEVKNYKGRIIGNENDGMWTQIKKSSSGEHYENSVKNPVKQAKFQSYLLSSILKEKGLNCYINPYVVFTGSESVNTDSGIVLRSENEFNSKILSFKEVRISNENVSKLKGVIECLQKSES